MTTQKTLQIGQYLIQEEMQEGLLGKNFACTHRFLKQPFILKCLPRELSNEEELIALLQKEIPRLASIEHPHIAPLHDVFIEEGRVFLASPCPFPLDEITNLRMLSTLNEQEIFSILKQIASALDAAHEKQQAHLGLKLSNVFISKQKVLLFDFGLMHLIVFSDFREKVFRALWDGFCKGKQQADYPETYAFLAPEQREENLGGDRGRLLCFWRAGSFFAVKPFSRGDFAFSQRKIRKKLGCSSRKLPTSRS